MITLGDTYQQTKRVVNTTTGTYQTVLTISQSVDIVGTYNCTVENARGVSSKLYPIAGSGELMIPYKHYSLRLQGQRTHSYRNIKFNIHIFTLNSQLSFCHQNKPSILVFYNLAQCTQAPSVDHTPFLYPIPLRWLVITITTVNWPLQSAMIGSILGRYFIMRRANTLLISPKKHMQPFVQSN